MCMKYGSPLVQSSEPAVVIIIYVASKEHYKHHLLYVPCSDGHQNYVGRDIRPMKPCSQQGSVIKASTVQFECLTLSDTDQDVPCDVIR